MEMLVARRDFTLAANTIPTILQTVASHVVPRGESRKMLRTAARLHFGAKMEATGDGMDVTFPLGFDIVASRNFPVPAIATVAAVAQTYVNDPAPGAGEFYIDFATDEITFGTAPAMGAAIVVYGPMADGDYSVEIISPSRRRQDTYGNGLNRRLAAAPQDDINSAFALNSQTPWLHQDYELAIQVRSTVQVNWDVANPYSEVVLPFVRAPTAALGEEARAEIVNTLGL